jgi:hypothetical protein
MCVFFFYLPREGYTFIVPDQEKKKKKKKKKKDLGCGCILGSGGSQYKAEHEPGGRSGPTRKRVTKRQEKEIKRALKQTHMLFFFLLFFFL